MAKWSLFSARRHIGISIKGDLLQLVEVTADSRGGSVGALHSVDASDPGALAKLVHSQGWKGHPATLVLSDKQMNTRTLELPPLPAKDLKRAIKRDVREHQQPDQFSAWRIYPAEGGRHQVVIRSASQEVIGEWCDRLATAGLMPWDIVSRSTAMVELITRHDGDGSNELVSLMDISDYETRIVMALHGLPISHRHINRGWLGTVTDEQGRGNNPLPPSFGEVELREDPLSTEDIEPPPSTSVEDSYSEGRERLAAELRRTHLHAKRSLDAGDVQRIVVIGPNDALPELMPWLASTSQAEPLTLAAHRSDLQWPEGEDPRGLLLPAGAALWGSATDNTSRRLVTEQRPSHSGLPFMSTAAGVLLACLAVYSGLNIWTLAEAITDQQQTVQMLEKKKLRVDQRYAEALAVQQKQFNAQANVFVLPAPFPGEGVLASLGKSLPANAYLREISARLNDGAWQLYAEGSIHNGPVPALNALGTLLQTLQQDRAFYQVSLGEIRAGLTDTPFSLTLTVRTVQ